jgi:GTPase SAR1 family protein
MARVAPANQEVVVSKEDDSSTADPAASNVSSDDRVGDMHQIKTITTDFPPKTSMKTQESPNAINNANDASSKFIVKKLKELYHNHVLEAEKRYHLHFNFDLPTDGAINDSEFDASPMVLLIGQYSTGKTTFVSHLLGEDFPGMHIGPEPTTDKFMALFYGGDKNNDGSDETSGKYINGFPKKTRGMQLDDDSVRSIATDGIIDARGRLVKGNTLTVTPTLPFSSLSQFGSAFLNHFVGSSSSSPLLKRITFIDTPGVLSGEKQRINRTYDFAQVAKWFADRSDLILLLFDAHKLDISDEFKNVIDTIRHYNDDKIRCVLNKADAVTREQLVRVYGSLMWSMGKIFDSPEVVRVYTGSYWNGALINSDFEYMFEKDEQLLVQELVDLPR